VDWNDLRLVLEVAENGGLLGGAKALDVHPTTVSRRIRQLEEGQRAKLFEKFRHGVVLTEAGADVVDVARQIRTLTNELGARLEGRDASLTGTVRLTAVDTLLKHWMPDFGVFQRRYPDIQLELSAGLAMANLTQREADVAVRIASAVPEHLIGARLCEVAHALYASDDVIARYGSSSALETYPWVAYDLAVFRGIDDLLATVAPEARIVLRVQRIDLLMSALEDGVGIGVLQCVAGDANPRLRRLDIPFDAGTSYLWVLTHPQLKGAARVAAFMRFLRELVARDKDLFEGRRPRAS
jgi:DNA-binding transcriptional LysR family regulator